jgi:hypothetical protein
LEAVPVSVTDHVDRRRVERSPQSVASPFRVSVRDFRRARSCVPTRDPCSPILPPVRRVPRAS